MHTVEPVYLAAAEIWIISEHEALPLFISILVTYTDTAHKTITTVIYIYIEREQE